jgi:signal peptidase I
MPNPFLHETEKAKPNILAEIIQALVVALIFNVVIYFLFLIPSQVDGPSMMPTLLDKELLFANKTASWFNNSPDTLDKLGWEYTHGDIIIFDYNSIVLVKRIIGVPGDKIKITADGDVYVNGEKQIENFLSPGVKTYLPQGGVRSFEPAQEVTVPPNSFFVMGDNRNNSKDSRFADVGFIPRTKIKGVVVFRFFPINKMGPLGKPQS